jgi:hypothetical protein
MILLKTNINSSSEYNFKPDYNKDKNTVIKIDYSCDFAETNRSLC